MQLPVGPPPDRCQGSRADFGFVRARRDALWERSFNMAADFLYCEAWRDPFESDLAASATMGYGTS